MYTEEVPLVVKKISSQILEWIYFLNHAPTSYFRFNFTSENWSMNLLNFGVKWMSFRMREVSLCDFCGEDGVKTRTLKAV